MEADLARDSGYHHDMRETQSNHHPLRKPKAQHTVVDQLMDHIVVTEKGSK